jgi:radical SAM protein with 4Fe4S-binding SPASM domain
MHPELPSYITWLRDKFPESQLLVYTNCELYRKNKEFHKVIDLFQRGLNLLQIDMYNDRTKNWVLDILDIYRPTLKEMGVKVYNFYEDKFNPWSFKGANKKILILADETKGFNYYAQTTRNAHTFGGNLPYENWKGYIDNKMYDFPLIKPCAEPLKYMTIGWSGDVYLCCTDGAKAIIIDNVHNKSINEIWQSENFNKLRLALKVKRRDLIPCCVLCNVNSIRSGLYAYWGNKYSLSEIIEEIEQCTMKVKEKEPLIKNLKMLERYKNLPQNIIDYIRRYP